MHTLKAVVRNGRIIVDEPTTLPEGSELKLQLVDEDDGLDVLRVGAWGCTPLRH
jgi:hypothetical protein